jgi:hypothetical protein
MEEVLIQENIPVAYIVYFCSLEIRGKLTDKWYAGKRDRHSKSSAPSAKV